jgi:F0F1-type ATP synthase membrane subunit a
MNGYLMKRRAGRTIILLCIGIFASKKYWMKNQLRTEQSQLAGQILAGFGHNFVKDGIYHYQMTVIPRFFQLLTFVKQCNKSDTCFFDTFLTRIDFI